MPETIKPCPFCGGVDIARAVQMNEERSGYFVGAECRTCRAIGPMIHHMGYSKKAVAYSVAAWNRRAITPALTTITDSADVLDEPEGFGNG